MPGPTIFRGAAGLALALGLAAAGPGAAATPPAPPADDQASASAPLPAEAVRADLRHLYDTLAAGHYDLFVYRSRGDYDAEFQRALATVSGPVPRREAAALFQRFLAYGRVGHARTEAPLQEFVSHLGRGGTLLPIFIRVDGDRVLVTRSADLAGRVGPGAELLAIEGQPVSQWLDRLGRLVSAERPYMVHAQMEESFPALLWLELGEREGVNATFRGADGRSFEARIPAVTRAELREIGLRHPTPRLGTDFASREVRLLPDGVAYLRPGPFMNTTAGRPGPEPSYEDGEYRTFLDGAFEAILAARAPDLVIDLRNNPGGDNSFSDAMVAWFADRPFRFASSFTLRASAPTKAWYRRRAEAGAVDGMLARLTAAEAGQPDGARYPFEIPLVQPRRGPRFEGRVWVLVNRHSYSNSASVAALIQDYGFGVVLGEETADVPTSHASTVHFELPNSGYSVAYPKSYFVRPSGDRAVRGVIPQVPLPREPIGVAADATLDAALAHIRGRR
ncbi:S41 family peptidase [Phenylobacterium sp.]|uniref:S41 family peptidase n=1 Tax=Phenylobacterium sp. TaxID=1871053 RepID=UPI002C359F6A|nr:S41 family peptidase [Phenylobacterium sp.]HVI33472.1 S41 family peptidase [Phenylobacterium sp.]